MRSFLALFLASALAACAGAPDSTSTDAQNDAVTSGTTAGTTLASFPGSRIFKPAHLPAPAIVMLHGSEGGSDGTMGGFAQEMTAKGFLVMTLCWFDCPGLPKVIERIPLEQVITAGQWLKSTPDSNGKVGLFGWSRGAEMALIVSSKSNLDPFSAVAVHAPSDTVVCGFNPATENQAPDYGGIIEQDASGADVLAPAWTWQGQDLFGERNPDFETPGPIIDVTAFKGPMYVSQGLQDEVWPVTRGKHVVAERAADPTLVTTSRFFPGEGHVLQKMADIITQDNDIAQLMHASLD